MIDTPRSTLRELTEIAQILGVQGLIQPELTVDLIVDVLRRPIADDRQHGIDRHHPADDEGDCGKPQEGEGESERNPRH